MTRLDKFKEIFPRWKIDSNGIPVTLNGCPQEFEPFWACRRDWSEPYGDVTCRACKQRFWGNEEIEVKFVKEVNGL